MAEHNPQILSYVHLNTYPRANDALEALKKISSLVKPIMRKRNWTLPTLAEFFPDQQNLLGININHGQKICLRLRHAGDKTQFMPLEDVTDTMLHELSHNVHGPHNEAFHALWNELRDEHEELVRKGYTAEGFVGQGNRLGGRHLPMREMRRQARVSAERRKILSGASGRKLGGAPVMRGTDMRHVIAEAAARRLTITQGCASNTRQGDEIAVEEAKNNGFRTKAEEEDANERAIAEALWELVQEDEARKAGLPAGAWKTENLTFNSNAGLDTPPQAQKPPSLSTAKESSFQTPRDLPKTKQPQPSKPATTTNSPPTWSCPICTLVNPNNFLTCDACASERPSAPLAQTITNLPTDKDKTSGPPRASTTDRKPQPQLQRPPPPSSSSSSSAAATKRKLSHSDLLVPKKMGWNCKRCGAFMEHRWWTCSACGVMKDSSA